LFLLTFLIGIRTADADAFAAASVYDPFFHIKRKRQTADRTFTMMDAVRLTEQLIVPYFRRPFLTRLLVLWTMILLTFNATIFHEFTCGAFPQFCVVNFCFAT
jgi:hypothetical protein